MGSKEPDVPASSTVVDTDGNSPLAVVGARGAVVANVAGLPGRVVVDGAGLERGLAGKDGDAVATTLEITHLAKDVVHVSEVGEILGFVDVMTFCVLVDFLETENVGLVLVDDGGLPCQVKYTVRSFELKNIYIRENLFSKK